MSAHYFEQLEAELRAAVPRIAGGHAQTPHQQFGWRPRAGDLIVALSVAVTIAIVALALGLLGHRHPATHSQAAAAPGRQQLISIIGVLRRPQRKGDLIPSVLRRLGQPLGLQGSPDLPLVRFATTAPWGERLYLVPEKPPTAPQIAAAVQRLDRLRAPRCRTQRCINRLRPLPGSYISQLRHRPELLDVAGSEFDGGGDDAAAIENGGALLTDSNLNGPRHGAPVWTRLVLVVPDGVAQVRFFMPRQPRPDLPGTPIYSDPPTATAAVHDNIAAVQMSGFFTGAAPAMIWYAPNGQVIKRIGDFAALGRVVSPPTPETPLSRAAERDPATPNPVWITPSIGSPTTHFMIHFRLLLSGASYKYELAGPPCPGTLNGGGGLNNNDIRGHLYTDWLDMVISEHWCPGTYRVSVAVTATGPYAPLKQPAKPFGSATFTVRP